MSLMPELERQLRAAVRSGRAASAADDRPPSRSRRRRSNALSAMIMMLSTVATIAIAAVILANVHASHRADGPGPTKPVTVTTGTVTAAFPHGTYCGEPVALNDVSNSHVVARSDRSTWIVARATVSLPRIRRFTGLVFDLGGGRVYLVCGGAVPNITQLPGRTVFWTLTDNTPTRQRVTIKGVTPSSIERQQVNDETFYVMFLPSSVCHDRSLTVGVDSTHVRQTFTQPMPKCLPATSPTVVPVSPPAGLTTQQVNEFNRGNVTFGQSGCFACHQLANNGNNGPGPNLTNIGSRLNTTQLARTLTNPTAPMPSFRALAHDYPKNFAALVYFLTKLTGQHR